MICFISDHAYARAKERFGIGKKSLCRLFHKAQRYGIGPKDTTVRLHKYLIGEVMKSGVPKNVRIYGEFVFIYDNECLITVFIIPRNLRKSANIQAKKRRYN